MNSRTQKRRTTRKNSKPKDNPKIKKLVQMLSKKRNAKNRERSKISKQKLITRV